MTQKRLKPAARRVDILEAALPLARTYGYKEITRSEVAAAAGVTGSAISYHFKTMDKFRAELMAYAIQHADPIVVAQGLAAADPAAFSAPDRLRRAAARALLN